MSTRQAPIRRIPSRPGYTRRGALFAMAGLVSLGVFGALFRPARGGNAPSQTPAGGAQDVEIEAFSKDGRSLGISRLPKVVKSDAEWKALLKSKNAEPLAFEVTRHDGTERAGTGRYADNHAPGIYTCICCGTALYDAKTKYESGTGWPSFWAPISTLNVAEGVDDSLFLRRTAVSCARCDAHLGHVFNDGPRPTGLRYCMNSAALDFVASA